MSRFTAREIRGATIRPSPANIAHRLQLIDQRPISNAVDATNYVLWESGKPTHVFDLDLLEGRRLVNRKVQAGETLKTLDGIERKLSTDDLVVADAKKPVGLAGVMGGLRHDDHRTHEEHPDRIRVVGRGHCAPDVEAARLSHGCLAPI